jgi:hypothetical protein
MNCSVSTLVDSLSNNQRFRLQRDGPTGLPLPEGEGRGEGEGRSRALQCIVRGRVFESSAAFPSTPDTLQIFLSTLPVSFD